MAEEVGLRLRKVPRVDRYRLMDGERLLDSVVLEEGSLEDVAKVLNELGLDDWGRDRYENVQEGRAAAPPTSPENPPGRASEGNGLISDGRSRAAEQG